MRPDTEHTRAGIKWALNRPRAETTLPRMMTPEIERALRKAGANVRKWTDERDSLIRQAVEAGGTLREVGEAVGITHTAVSFIAHGRPRS